MSPDWETVPTSGRDEVDLRFRRRQDASWVIVQGYALSDEHRQMALKDLFTKMLPQISVIGVRLSGSRVPSNLEFHMQTDLILSRVQDRESIEVAMAVKPDRLRQRLQIMLMRSIRGPEAVILIYSNDPEHFASGLDEARNLGSRIRFP